jgi:hypothetical protein
MGFLLLGVAGMRFTVDGGCRLDDPELPVLEA